MSITPPPSLLFFLLLSIPLTFSQTTDSFDASWPSSPTLPASFRPSVPVVVGIFSLMFSLTFLLLLYAKFCHFSSYSSHLDTAGSAGPGSLFLSDHRRFSGLNKSLVDSLPFFPFSSLRGLRHGLECAVCLSKFDDTEVLRLLPKCKHAFHINCVDRWLENHSSCPLCRSKVNAEDANAFKLSSSSRFLFTSQRFDSDQLELFVERQPSSRSFRGTGKNGLDYKEQSLPIATDHVDCEQNFDKLNHRIVFSDAVFKGRWSDLNSRDFMSLNCEILSCASSTRFAVAEQQLNSTEKSNGASVEVLKIKEELDRKRLVGMKTNEMNRASNLCLDSEDHNRELNSLERRSFSEITNMSRFRQYSSSGNRSNGSDKEEKVRRVWLPIARRTVQWFAGRERRTQTANSGSECTNV